MSIRAAVQSAGRMAARRRQPAPGGRAADSGCARISRSAVAGHDSAQHSPHVGVDRTDRPTEGDGRHGAGGVRTDTRHRLERGQVVGHLPTMPLDDDPRRALQVERPSVVAEAGPLAEDLRRRRGGERVDGRKAGHEGSPGRLAAARLRLLEDDLRDEDRVGVPETTELEGAGLAVVPGQDGGLHPGRQPLTRGHSRSLWVRQICASGGTLGRAWEPRR